MNSCLQRESSSFHSFVFYFHAAPVEPPMLYNVKRVNESSFAIYVMVSKSVHEVPIKMNR